MAAKYKKRADGRYLIQIQIGFQDNGKPKFKNIYARTIKELEEKAATFRQELEHGIVVDDNDMTVAQWAHKWLEVYKTGKEYGTMRMYNNAINNHIIPIIGHYKLKDLKPHHVQELINQRYNEGITKTLLTINHTINQILEQAVTNQYIHRNVARNLKIPNIPKPKKRSLSTQEQSFILKADFDLRSKALVFLLLFCGLRRGEALSLTKNDINLKDKSISISKNLVFKNNKADIKPTPKTESGNRVVPMPDILHSVMTEYLKTITTYYIFSSLTSGEIISETSFRRMWEKILNRINEAAGGKSGRMKVIAIANDITPHIFRHTYATSLYYAGVDIKTAQYLLGHASVEITLDIYTHLAAEENKEVANKLNMFYNNEAVKAVNISQSVISHI